MKLKCLVALLLCVVLLSCTGCGETIVNKINSLNDETTVNERVTTAQVSPQALYDEFLTEQFQTYVKVDDSSSGLRNPPQFNLASQRYTFYDVDKDGTEELLILLSSGDDNSEDKVYSMYTVRSGTIKEIPIRTYILAGTSFYPVLMSDGTMRATVGFGHVPGYAYLHMLAGAYEVKDVLTPPCKTAQYTQKNYEYRHYEDDYFTQIGAEESVKTEVITDLEFENRIEELNGDATPVKLELKSLLEFGQSHKLSTKWLDEPVDKVFPVTLPKDAPLPNGEDTEKKNRDRLLGELISYRNKIESFNAPDVIFNQKMPAERFFAFCDLDGNGDNEIFFGDKNENGKILITDWFNEDVKNHVSNFASVEPNDTRVLSNGLVVVEYVISEGEIPGKILNYRGVESKASDEIGNGRYYHNMALWSYGDEAAFYDYSNQTSRLPASLTQAAYERQRAALENGTVVELNWKPIADYDISQFQ